MDKNSRGFTLIELMIVVGIIGLLAAIAVPAYTDQVRKARRADGMDALLDCAAAQARNYTTASPPTYLDQDAAADAGICNNLLSKEGFYNLTVANLGCNQNGSLWCFVLTARPVNNRAQANDICATMTVDHRGNKRAFDSDGEDISATCWRS